ncbi:heparanase-like protein 3, partial [Camellia sinensis]|uniref:heparanase-like protein 3 n=1 Tax=Camellia sinensis TaxID=4442 RepID=UPI0010368DC0
LTKSSGNELSGNGVGARVAAIQFVSDVIALQNIVQNTYKGFQVKPIVLGPGGFFDSNWFTEFVDKTPNSLQVITHHIYNLGPGVDDHLVAKILDPSYLDGESQQFSNLQSILKASGTSTVAWVGEAGGAYNSGRNLVTNAFVFSFWYLDQLGMAASYDTKTYCRQTLIGGNYGLLNTTTFVPNPDYYSALEHNPEAFCKKKTFQLIFWMKLQSKPQALEHRRLKDVTSDWLFPLFAVISTICLVDLDNCDMLLPFFHGCWCRGHAPSQ